MKQKKLRDRELNPGLLRDRQEYQPLYYLGLLEFILLKRLVIFTNLFENNQLIAYANCQQFTKYKLKILRFFTNLIPNNYIKKIISNQSSAHLIVSVSSPPQPKGTYKVGVAKPDPTDFKNPFFRPCEFTVRLDNPCFTISVNKSSQDRCNFILKIKVLILKSGKESTWYQCIIQNHPWLIFKRQTHYANRFIFQQLHIILYYLF
ncbi:hypothetical protein TTHERM_000550971 (macronuclear) [Tetrahymena thermophila SB210]|uniref:Uncharacterized protein n=1 Tax=Tetrahymena thermophila (strain SB210) TaxID=312017 RepID=W7XGG9_TETTS|nr:hypothetical protein TTHERM_000550971 [Tetrahymena thermophila SB210]EWS76078.1 hypothetical protein TTHERM_000550971 [Tetrahymena thermophila SB210]|eukprot:XP_012651385.1 hypothetical protein TTHERM_000550971 [Tetrahymena thermophila SB210]